MDKEIRTGRLIMKPYEENNRDGLAELLTNEQIKETFMIPEFTSQKSLDDAVDKLYRASLSDEHFERGIFLQDVLIGFVNDVYMSDDSIEIGFAIHPNYHNHGYATEMLCAVIRSLLNNGYSSVIAGAFEQNCASIRVMQKSGMTKIDKEEDILYHGTTMHCVYFSISK